MGYWKVAQGALELVSKSNDIGREILDVDNAGGPDISGRQLTEVLSDKKENQITKHGKSHNFGNVSGEDHERLLDITGSGAIIAKDAKGQGCKPSDLAKTIGVVPESESGSRSSIVQNEYGKAETLKENSIKESSNVEVWNFQLCAIAFFHLIAVN